MFENKRKNLIYIVILLIPFLLFFSRRSLLPLRYAIIDILAFPIKIVSFPFYELKKMVFYHRTFEELKRERIKNKGLQTRLVGFEEMLKENTRLQGLLEFKRKSVYSSVVAEVIGRDPTSWNSTIIISKGSDDGVKLGAAVVNAAGIVGKVAEVGAHKAKVVLLTDPQFSVAAMIQRPRESGIITGSLQGLCWMRFLSEQADIQVGDLVITSKLSMAFPENLVIGEVISIQQDPSKSTTQCLVKPAVSLSQLEEVLVILE